MNISELLGFIITILVLIYAIGRRMFEEKYRREHPEEYAKKKRDEEEAFKHFLRSLDIQVEEGSPPSPPPPPAFPKPAKTPVPRAYVPPSTVAEGFEFKSGLDDFQQKSRVEERDFHSNIEEISGRKLVSKRIKDKPLQRAYRYQEREGPSRANHLIRDLDDRRKLLLIHDIFGPPKADHWQDDPFSK